MKHLRPIAITATAVVLLAIGLYALTGNRITPSFYYWKTTFRLSPHEHRLLASQQVDELFVRFFDVDREASQGKAQPLGMLTVRDTSLRGFKVIPVVFITNRVFQQAPPEEVKQLANHVWSTIRHMADEHHLQMSEIQIDCDWTESSKAAYFGFLSQLKEQLLPLQLPLSATIRLHQVKHPARTGIPPVDRGMLMFYNMGNLNDTTSNSIYNSRDAAKYVTSVRDYPLPLDVALPLFSWVVHEREQRIIELMSNTYAHELDTLPGVVRTDGGHYRVEQAQYFRGAYLRRGDRLRAQAVPPALALEAARQLAPHLRAEHRRVALFRLDSLTLLHYEEKEIQAIVDCFR